MRKFLLWIWIALPGSGFAQHYSIKGTVKDTEGDRLPLAHIILLPDSTITTTNTDGKFSITTTAGSKSITVSYTGYLSFYFQMPVTGDTVLVITLQPKVAQLQEVEVVSKKYSQQDFFESTRTGTTTLTQDDINAIPVLGGEADIIKTLQLLPGTIRGVEGSSDLFVRGGAADQNLLLLDEAPVYNSGHLLGFMSVFNPDILEKVDAVIGGFPAEYGGRLSSILDIKTKNTIAKKTFISGDAGLIASRLYIEQPIVTDKASFWVAGRRTYIDQVVKALGEEMPYFFYDLNGKLILQPVQKDNIQFSYYVGDDVLDLFRDRNNDGDGITTTFESGNNSQSLQWTHEWSNGWSSRSTLLRSMYRYNIRNAFEENELFASSDIEDIGARILFMKTPANESRPSIKAGIDWTRHFVSPNVVNTAGTISELLESSSTKGRTAHEMAAHFQNEWSPAQRWLVSAGIRLSSAIVENKTYLYPEPRFSLRYSLKNSNSVKWSYSRMVQYMHRVSSSAVSAPTDIWYPVTNDIVPQTSHQISIAWQRFLSSSRVFLGVEGYYKQMDHLIGYEEGTNLFLNTDFESKLIQGKGKAYGLELLLRKEAGKLTGWMSYTLSWSWRQFDEIENGDWFYSRYDRRHNGALVMQYAFNKRWAASMVWEFISGSRFTPVIGQYGIFSPTLTGIDLIPLYAPVNSVKLTDTHRLDVGIKYKHKPGRKFQWQWFAGVYNAYNRANPVGITVEQDETDGSLYYQQPGLFGLIPFISYGFKF